jgi:hypothetical protein
VPALDLISITEAAAFLQPFLGDLSAINWLADMRRLKAVYRDRVFNRPKWCRHEGRIKYPRTEMKRLVDELILARAMTPALH